MKWLPLLLALNGCAVVAVHPTRIDVQTLGEAQVAVVQSEAQTTVTVKGAALSSIGAGVLSSAITAASMYFGGVH